MLVPSIRIHPMASLYPKSGTCDGVGSVVANGVLETVNVVLSHGTAVHDAEGRTAGDEGETEMTSVGGTDTVIVMKVETSDI